jgi:excisionase family DNA binding protein
VNASTSPALLTPAEVARMFSVDPKTVTRWARSGRLEAIRTPGGHRRYSKAQIVAMLNGQPVPDWLNGGAR